MANAWSADDIYSLAAPLAVGASATNAVVSREFPVTAAGALNMVVALDVSAVTVATGITAKLQSAIGSVWVDAKTASITTAGRVYIKLNIEVSGDQTHLPLLSKARLVISTGAGDAVTVDKVYVVQAL
jgi:hypothetical protein